MTRQGLARLTQSTSLPLRHEFVALLLEERAEAQRHEVDARTLVCVVRLRVGEHELHVLEEVFGVGVVVVLQVLANRTEVHRVIDESQVLGIHLRVDGRAKRFAVRMR